MRDFFAMTTTVGCFWMHRAVVEKISRDKKQNMNRSCQVSRDYPLLDYVKVFFLMWLMCQPAPGQVSSALQNQEEVLTGSRVQAKDIITRSEAIFVGEIAKLGDADFKGKGILTYWSVPIKVDQILKGDVASEIKATLHVNVMPDLAETPPQTNLS